MKTVGVVLVCMHWWVAMAGEWPSFVKDLSMDVPFPPVDTRSAAGLPDGHLRPLGWQKKPDGKVREEREATSANIFHFRYVRNARPVVMRQTLHDADVIARWAEDSYLQDKYGELNMTVTVKRNFSPVRDDKHMLLRTFLLDYKYENWYLSSTIPDEMVHELPVAGMMNCGTYKSRLMEAELWMSSGGTASPLHSHAYHNLHCVIDGRKDFILIDSEYKKAFNYKETYPDSEAGYSPLDMDMISVFQYPKIPQTPWIWSTLTRGDCIFVPAGYLHQVRSYGRGISYTILFSPTLKFDSSDCEDRQDVMSRKKSRKSKEVQKEETKKQLYLSDVEFVWRYSHGDRQLTDRALVPKSLQSLLLLLLKAGDRLYLEEFKHFYDDAMKLDPAKPPAEEAFNILAPNKEQTYLSRDEVMSLKPARLQDVCDIFNRRHQRVHEEL